MGSMSRRFRKSGKGNKLKHLEGGKTKSRKFSALPRDGGIHVSNDFGSRVIFVPYNEDLPGIPKGSTIMITRVTDEELQARRDREAERQAIETRREALKERKS